jgi:hypothetical protein
MRVAGEKKPRSFHRIFVWKNQWVRRGAAASQARRARLDRDGVTSRACMARFADSRPTARVSVREVRASVAAAGSTTTAAAHARVQAEVVMRMRRFSSSRSMIDILAHEIHNCSRYAIAT